MTTLVRPEKIREKFTWRFIALLAIGAGLLLFAQPRAPWYAIGLVPCALGLGTRLWACGYLEKNRRVVTAGPYARVRHPLYLGSFLIALGFLISCGSTAQRGQWVWIAGGPLLMAVFFGLYMPRKGGTESARLERRFGEEYTRWKTSVPAFLPALRPYPHREQATWSPALVVRNKEVHVLVSIAILFVAVYLRSLL